MSNSSYTLKPRPNLYDLSIMDGVLNGGGVVEPVRREAYWAPTPSNSLTAEQQELVEFNLYPEKTIKSFVDIFKPPL